MNKQAFKLFAELFRINTLLIIHKQSNSINSSIMYILLKEKQTELKEKIKNIIHNS